MALDISKFKFEKEKWKVSRFLTDGATHTTIAAAIADASYGDSIFVRPGTYTENLTVKKGFSLVAHQEPCSKVEIIGKCTAKYGAAHVFSGIRLVTCTSGISTIDSPVIEIYF
jgi:pectin methylesterase-like acyl-CoA thioesterase